MHVHFGNQRKACMCASACPLLITFPTASPGGAGFHLLQHTMQVSADLLDKADLLGPEETAALRAHRAELTANEAALKVHLQQQASCNSAPTSSAPQLDRALPMGSTHWPAQPQQPIAAGPSHPQCNPWDSAGSQLRSAAADMPGRMNQRPPLGTWQTDAGEGMSSMHPGGASGTRQQNQHGWDNGGSGRLQGPAGMH